VQYYDKIQHDLLHLLRLCVCGGRGRGCGRGLCVFGELWVDMWRLVPQWSFLLFWLSLDCFWPFLTIGVPIVTGLPSKDNTVKQQKMTIGVPIVTCLLRVRRIHKAFASVICITKAHKCSSYLHTLQGQPDRPITLRCTAILVSHRKPSMPHVMLMFDFSYRASKYTIYQMVPLSMTLSDL